MKRIAIVLLTVCLVTGCTPIERTAYNTVVAAKAFLDSVKSQHPACASTVNTSTLCNDLRKATSAKDLLIDAGEAYCHVDILATTDTTPCNPATAGTPAYQQAIAALQQALSGYSQAEKDLKGVIQ